MSIKTDLQVTPFHSIDPSDIMMPSHFDDINLKNECELFDTYVRQELKRTPLLNKTMEDLILLASQLNGFQGTIGDITPFGCCSGKRDFARQAKLLHEVDFLIAQVEQLRQKLISYQKADAAGSRSVTFSTSATAIPPDCYFEIAYKCAIKDRDDVAATTAPATPAQSVRPLTPGPTSRTQRTSGSCLMPTDTELCSAVNSLNLELTQKRIGLLRYEEMFFKQAEQVACRLQRIYEDAINSHPNGLPISSEEHVVKTKTNEAVTTKLSDAELVERRKLTSEEQDCLAKLNAALTEEIKKMMEDPAAAIPFGDRLIEINKHMRENQIIPHVFLGNDLSLLAIRPINGLGCTGNYNNYTRIVEIVLHLINFSLRDIPSSIDRRITLISSNDAWETLEKSFEDVFLMIDKARASGENILIVSNEGISRCVTFLLAYLINRFKISPQQALRFVKLKWPIANPSQPLMIGLEGYFKRCLGS